MVASSGKKNVKVKLYDNAVSEKKDWVDAQGNKGKGYGQYRFRNKYGGNVDEYSPIWTPSTSRPPCFTSPSFVLPA